MVSHPQVPAVLSSGLTVVISPLLSLIQDQVLACIHSTAAGIPTTYLSSEQTEVAARAAYRELHKPEPSCKLLYVTPERVKCAGLEDVFNKLYENVLALCACRLAVVAVAAAVYSGMCMTGYACTFCGGRSALCEPLGP
jgi:superfamily II DNA helicase RecQ